MHKLYLCQKQEAMFVPEARSHVQTAPQAAQEGAKTSRLHDRNSTNTLKRPGPPPQAPLPTEAQPPQSQSPLVTDSSTTNSYSPAANVPAATNTPHANFQWGEKTGDEFCQLIETAYEEIVHWRQNIFLAPSGKAGKAFIRELA